MAHHSDLASLRERFEEYANLGATGKYPNGKLAEHDEGEIRFAVAADVRRGVVIIDFGKSVRSMGMTGEQAADLRAQILGSAYRRVGVGREVSSSRVPYWCADFA